jgi:hypothetical protein
MAGILGNRSNSIKDILIQSITLEPRLAGLVQQGPGEAEIFVAYGIQRQAKTII